MTRPTKHPKSGVYRIRMAVPMHLRSIVKRAHGRSAELVESLGTKDPGEAKRLATPVIEKFSTWLRAAEAEHSGEQVYLTDREIAALCGRWLADREAENEHRLTGTTESFEAVADHLAPILAALDGHENEVANPVREAIKATEELVMSLLASQGLHVDADTHARLAVRLAHIEWQWARDMAERARSGRWRPSISSADFPSRGGGLELYQPGARGS